jgi:hypothetical protein
MTERYRDRERRRDRGLEVETEKRIRDDREVQRQSGKKKTVSEG